jgi:hypothetical protein
MESVEGVAFIGVGEDAKSSSSGSKSADLIYQLVVATATGNLIVYAVHVSAVHGNTYSFKCEPYMTSSINKSSSSSSAEPVSEDLSDSLSIANTITSLQHLPKSNVLVVTTADNAICEFTASKPIDHRMGLRQGRQFVGSFDDILDIGYIPGGTEGPSSFLLAIVSNSPHVRLLNDKYNCHSTFFGHTDIVLAVDVCPTGYVVCC